MFEILDASRTDKFGRERVYHRTLEFNHPVDWVNYVRYRDVREGHTHISYLVKVTPGVRKNKTIPGPP